MLKQFYDQVEQALKTNHVLVLVDDTPEQTERRAEDMFCYLIECIRDRMNALEAISTNDTFLCVRHLLERMPPVAANSSKDPVYKFLLMPPEE